MTGRALSRSRLDRARASQGVVAEYLQGHGFPHAEPVWGSMPGRDVTGCPGLAPEVKATRDVPLLAALRQATKTADGDLPLVVWRPDGYGPQRVQEWVVALTLADAVRLLRAAGYGTPESAA